MGGIRNVDDDDEEDSDILGVDASNYNRPIYPSFAAFV